jgi:hypothetical protein
VPSSCDVGLDDGTSALALQLYQDARTSKSIRTSWEPATSGTQDAIWGDFKNGYGYSQPGIVADGYGYGINVDTRSPGVVVPSGAITEVDITSAAAFGLVSQIITFGGDLYMLAGRILAKFALGYGAPSQAADIGLGNSFVTAVYGRFSGTPYLWLGQTNGFSSWNGTTLGTTTSFVRGYMASVYWATTDGVQVQRLVSNDTLYTVKHCPLTVDPTVGGNWSAQIVVGEGVNPVQSVVSSGHHVYVSTTGGIYDIDDLQQTFNLTPYYADQYSVNNGLATMFFDGRILYSTDIGIDAIDVSQQGLKQSEANWATPGASTSIPNETPIWGVPTAFANDAGWAVASIYSGTASYLIYGKRRARLGIEGPGEWIWHGAFAKFDAQRITNLYVATVVQSGVTSRRLWITTIKSDLTSTASRVFYQSLPLTTTARQDALIPTAHRYATSFSLYMTPSHFGAPAHDKTALRATFDSRDLNSSVTLGLYLATDEETFGSSLGTVSESDVVELPLTATAITGGQLTPLVVGAGTTTAPPVFRSLTIQAAIDPQQQEVYEFDVVFQRDQVGASGGANPHGTPETDYVLLTAMLGQTVTLTDPLENEVTVSLLSVLPGTIREIERSRDGRRGWGRVVTVRALVVDIPARYGDDTALYGVAVYAA